NTLDFAKVQGWRAGDNPAIWKGDMEYKVPYTPSPLRLREAMPWPEVPAFIKELRLHQDIAPSAVALEFLIYTVARRGEVLGAVWSEFNLDDLALAPLVTVPIVWTIPGERMKTRKVYEKPKDHSVPLTARPLTLLQRRKEVSISPYVFTGRSKVE